RALRITMACWPVGTLTPGKAGEMLKAAALPDRLTGLGTVIMERLIDVAVLGAAGVVFGLLSGSLWAAAGGAFGLAAALGVMGTAPVLQRLLHGRPLAYKLTGFLGVGPRLLRQPRLLTACVSASALNWF